MSTSPLAPETRRHHHQRREQWLGQEEEKSAEPPSLCIGQEQQRQPPPPPPPPPQQQQHQQQQQEEQQKQPDPVLFPPSTTANGTTTTTPSISSCPSLEELIDMFFVQARCKFVDQFDETAKTMSRMMKNEISLLAELERQRRAEWEVSKVNALQLEVKELRANKDQLTEELEMIRMPMMETPSSLRSGMPCMSGGDFHLPRGTASAGAGPPLRTPASRLSLFSLSSVSGKIDATAALDNGTTSASLPGLFGTAGAAKLVPSPLPLQPRPQSQPQPQLQPPAQPQPQRTVQPESIPEQSQPQPEPEPEQEQQSQPQPGQQSKPQVQAQLQPLPLEATPTNMAVVTTPVASYPPTPSSVLLADARTAAFQGACTPTGIHDAAAAAAAVAAQSAFLAAYYSGNSQNMVSPAPVPLAASVPAPATPAPVTALTSDDQHPTAEITGQGLEIADPTAVVVATDPPPATAAVTATASPPTAAVTNAVARNVPDGAKARDVSVIAAATAAATAAAVVATTPGPTPLSPFVPRLSSAGRRSSLPVGGMSRRRISVPAGLPFAVFSENMPPPQPRTPFSTAKKAPICFGATPLRSPLGEIRVNAAATCLSPAVNIAGAKKTAGSGGSADGGFGGIGGGGDGSMGSHDTSKDCEMVWDGKRPASAISASATKKGNGEDVGASQSPRKSNARRVTKRAKKVLPQSQRVLRSASRASGAASASTVAVVVAAKDSPQQPSTAKAVQPRTTRSATLRSAGRTSGDRGSFCRTVS